MHRHAVPWLPAVVPGHIHETLTVNQIIADPFKGLHELGCEWVDETDWEYRCEFEWLPADGCPRRVLRFDSLDTVCEVELNGKPLGSSRNMFVPAEFDVSDVLATGVNEIRVTFRSAVREGLRLRQAYFEGEGLPWDSDWFDERAFVRKAQYMTGWDWGPRLVSCGIPGPVTLIEFSGRVIDLMINQTKLPSGEFEILVSGEIEGEGRETVLVGGTAAKFGEPIRLQADLWWPANEGPQTLHTVNVNLDTGFEVTKRVGLRTVRLLREQDALGQSFEFEVNGRRLWARGANWIPDDSFIGRSDLAGLQNRAKSYAQLGMNMLRVWGGGFYESEAFYDACDASGILVWQDFSFACSYYPEDEAFTEQVRLEAIHHVKRLQHRASLALWCGNNENEVMWVQRWGGDKAPTRYYGEKFYNEVLPDIVKAFSPSTPYLRSSPIGLTPDPQRPEIKPDMLGDSHYWDVWHGRGDWIHYSDSETRFSSEYGFASSCSLECWKQVSEPLPTSEYDPAIRWHEKTKKGYDKFHSYVELHYPVAQTLEEWVYYSQLNQRDAMRHAIEHYRRSDHCRGSLIWQLNDCWPVQSWSLEDYARLLKPAGHELKRLYAQQLIIIVPQVDSAELWLVNDSQNMLEDQVSCRLVSTLSGQDLLNLQLETQLGPGERRKIGTVPFGSFDRSTTAICARIDARNETETWRWLKEPKEMQFLPPQITMNYTRGQMTLEVKGFAADLVVWDEDDPLRVISSQTGLPGWCAQTVANGSAHYQMSGQPTSLRFRLLGMT